MARFNPGDKCVIVDGPFISGREHIGRVVTLAYSYISSTAVCWKIEEPLRGFCGVYEGVLRKVDDPPAREPLGSWAECPWKPSEVINKTRETALV